jgi:hypothetical protein
MANPNIVNVTTIYGNTATLAVSTVTTNVVANPASSGQVYKVNALTIANINTTSSAVNINVEYNNAGSNTYLARNVVVPANSSLVILGKDTATYLLENTSLQLTAGSNNSLSAIVTFEQIS